jgi:hypothetical protein
MMFIYLDTSQIFEITKLLDIDKESSDLFFRQWNEKAAVLCLSFSHLKEIAQLKDKKSRKTRFAVLQRFNYLCFTPLESSSIIRMEATIQMLDHISKKGITIQLPKTNIWKKTTSDFLYDYVETNRDKLLEARKYYTAASEIEEVFKPVKKLLIKYGISRFESLSANTAKLEEATRIIVEGSEPANQKRGSSNISFEKVLAVVRKTGTLSSALISHLELDGLSDIKKRYLSDAGSLSVLFKMAREAIPHVAELSGESQSEATRAISYIEPAKCPGFSLRMALIRGFLSSDKKNKPSDWLDATHIVYAPYVDILFADKRTHDYLHKETRNQRYRIEQSLLSNIRRIVPMNALLGEISI